MHSYFEWAGFFSVFNASLSLKLKPLFLQARRRSLCCAMQYFNRWISSSHLRPWQLQRRDATHGGGGINMSTTHCQNVSFVARILRNLRFALEWNVPIGLIGAKKCIFAAVIFFEIHGKLWILGDAIHTLNSNRNVDLLIYYQFVSLGVAITVLLDSNLIFNWLLTQYTVLSLKPWLSDWLTPLSFNNT